MADISTWSPVDASNNQPPPDGWPENQSPSSVNDCARAMMGAIRRFYDQIIAGSLSLPYLPLAGGGTITGNVDITGALTAGQIATPGDAVVTGTVTAQQLTSSGNINASGTVTAVAVNGDTITATTLNCNGSLGVAVNATVANNIACGNTVSAHAFVDTDGLYSVFDVLRDLQARVEALEGAAHAR